MTVSVAAFSDASRASFVGGADIVWLMCVSVKI